MPGHIVASRPDLPFVGRRSELAALEAAFDRAAGGVPTVALVSGEAGIGKSALAAELARRARERDALVHVGACVELSVPVPYLPLTALVGPVAPDAPAPAAEAAVPSPEAARARLFEDALTRVAELARQRPTLIVVDDLQWADRSTIDLLRFLARAVQDERLLLLVTCRSPPAIVSAPAREAFADLGRSPRAAFVELQGLAPDAVGELLALLLGHAPDADVAADVSRRSQGNPFYVERLAEHGARDASLPQRLRDVMLASRDGLSADTLRVLDVLAVGVEAVAHDALADVAGVADEALDEALRPAVDRRLVRVEAGAYALGHALLAEALRERLLPGETRRLHRAFAERLDVPGARASVLAHHWRAADVPERALPAAIAAGHAAWAACASPEAHDHFEAALTLLERLGPDADDGMQRAELLPIAAEAAAAAGRFDDAARRFRDALDSAHRPAAEQAVLHVRLAYTVFRLGNVPEQLALIGGAAELVDPLPPSAARSDVLGRAALARAISLHDVTARPVAEQALADAMAVGARPEEGRALIALAVILDLEGRVEEAIASLGQAWDIAVEVSAEEDAARAAMNLSWLLGNAGRAADAVAAAQRGAARARGAGLERAFTTVLRANAVSALVLAGELAQAAELAARPIPPASDVWAAVMMLSRRAQLAHLRGEDEPARAMLARAQELARALPPTHPLRADIAHVDALIALDAGDAAAALDEAGTAIAQIAPGERLGVLELACVGVRAAADAALRAQALRRHDEAEAARRAGRALVERGTLPGAPGSLREGALAAQLAAETARLDGTPAADRWREAIAAWSRLGPGPGAAYASYRLAEALVAARAPAAELRPALADALERAQALALPRLESAVAALARERRVAMPTRPEDEATRELTRLGLTRREVDVLQHLVDGRTNRGIAAALVISEKTAGHHVSSILAKLQVSTRGEAAAMARRLGVDPPPSVAP